MSILGITSCTLESTLESLWLSVSGSVLPVFSSSWFRVSGFTVSSLIHFWGQDVVLISSLYTWVCTFPSSICCIGFKEVSALKKTFVKCSVTQLTLVLFCIIFSILLLCMSVFMSTVLLMKMALECTLRLVYLGLPELLRIAFVFWDFFGAFS